MSWIAPVPAPTEPAPLRLQALHPAADRLGHCSGAFELNRVPRRRPSALSPNAGLSAGSADLAPPENCEDSCSGFHRAGSIERLWAVVVASPSLCPCLSLTSGAVLHQGLRRCRIVLW